MWSRQADAMLLKLADQVDKHIFYGSCDHSDCEQCNTDLRKRREEARIAESNSRWRAWVDGEQ